MRAPENSNDSGRRWPAVVAGLFLVYLLGIGPVEANYEMLPQYFRVPYEPLRAFLLMLTDEFPSVGRALHSYVLLWD